MTRRDIERRLDDLEELFTDGGDEDGLDTSEELTDEDREHLSKMLGDDVEHVRERVEQLAEERYSHVETETGLDRDVATGEPFDVGISAEDRAYLDCLYGDGLDAEGEP